MIKLSIIGSILLGSMCYAGVVAPRAPPVVCLTKDTSPLLADVQQLHDQVAKYYSCTNKFGGCHQLSWAGTAALQHCGDGTGVWDNDTWGCETYAEILQEVINQCTKDGKAEGYAFTTMHGRTKDYNENIGVVHQ